MKFPWELWAEKIVVGLIGGQPLFWQGYKKSLFSVTFIKGWYSKLTLVPFRNRGFLMSRKLCTKFKS